MALGGDGGAGNNAAIGLMGVVGLSDAVADSVTLNELTTVAGEWALSQFLDSTGQQAGAPLSNAIGIVNAAAQATDNLVDSTTGEPAHHLPSALAVFERIAADQLRRARSAQYAGQYNRRVRAELGAERDPAVVRGGDQRMRHPAGLQRHAADGTTLQAAHSIATNPAEQREQLFAAQDLAHTVSAHPAAGARGL